MKKNIHDFLDPFLQEKYLILQGLCKAYKIAITYKENLDKIDIEINNLFNDVVSHITYKNNIRFPDFTTNPFTKELYITYPEKLTPIEKQMLNNYKVFHDTHFENFQECLVIIQAEGSAAGIKQGYEQLAEKYVAEKHGSQIEFYQKVLAHIEDRQALNTPELNPDKAFDLSQRMKVVNHLMKRQMEIEIPANNFKPKPGLDKVVFKDFVFQFGQIEHELISREYLSDKYKWLKNKKIFCEFLVVILSYGYTANKIAGKTVSDTDVRRFFEERYGKPKKYLSNMFRRSDRPEFNTAKFSFDFISKPQEKKETTPYQHKPIKL